MEKMKENDMGIAIGNAGARDLAGLGINLSSEGP